MTAKDAQAKDEGIGRDVPRKEDQRFLTGAGHYTDDVNLPGQVYAVMVRSPHARAAEPSMPRRRACACGERTMTA